MMKSCSILVHLGVANAGSFIMALTEDTLCLITTHSFLDLVMKKTVWCSSFIDIFFSVMGVFKYGVITTFFLKA